MNSEKKSLIFYMYSNGWINTEHTCILENNPFFLNERKQHNNSFLLTVNISLQSDK